jgi:hypothetical protein
MIYDVACVHCQETLVTTSRIGDAEARIVVEHLVMRHPECVHMQPAAHARAGVRAARRPRSLS